MDADFIRDLFSEFGPVQVRRMFGGAGIYVDGVMFALVAREVLYLKADSVLSERFSAEGCGPFEYATKSGKRALTSYWRLPDRLYDEPGELAGWARRSLSLAQRARVPRKRRLMRPD